MGGLRFSSYWISVIKKIMKVKNNFGIKKMDILHYILNLASRVMGFMLFVACVMNFSMVASIKWEVL